MSKSIIQSIAAIVAAGVWPEMWHPEHGRIGNVGAIHKDWVEVDGRGVAGSVLDSCKIIRKPFQHLVERVKADPQSNPASDAFGGFVKVYEDIGVITKPHEITVWLNEIDNITVNADWEMKPNGNFFYQFTFPVISLLASGYGPGLPDDHVIFEEDLK